MGNSQNPSTAQVSQTKLAVGALFFVTGLLSLSPMAILGPAIGWPASLSAPVVQQITAIAGAPSAVASGYGVYLLYSLLILPLMVFLAREVWHEDQYKLANSLAQVVIGFAAVSVLARSIGILRWLTVLPELARSYGSADPATQATIALVFKSISQYGGGIGELLGVSLFMSISLGIAMIAALVNRSLPRWLSLFGLFAALALFGMFLPAVGVAIKVPVVIAVSALSFWMWAYAGWSIVGGLRSKPAIAAA
jgi:hypothetical protein